MNPEDYLLDQEIAVLDTHETIVENEYIEDGFEEEEVDYVIVTDEKLEKLHLSVFVLLYEIFLIVKRILDKGLSLPLKGHMADISFMMIVDPFMEGVEMDGFTLSYHLQDEWDSIEDMILAFSLISKTDFEQYLLSKDDNNSGTPSPAQLFPEYVTPKARTEFIHRQYPFTAEEAEATIGALKSELDFLSLFESQEGDERKPMTDAHGVPVPFVETPLSSYVSA